MRYGGMVAGKATSAITHVISDSPIIDEALKELKEDNDDIKFINPEWVKDSITQQHEIACDKYLL